MLFNSLVFLLFLPIVFIGHYFVFRRLEIGQVIFLTACSLFFYGYADPSLITLLVVSLLVNGFCTHALMDQRWKTRWRKLLFIGTLVFNLGLLAFFKYAYLLGCAFLDADQHRAILASLQSIPLPVGISFYTFQAVSLCFDVYRGKTEGLENLYDQHNPLKFHLYTWFYISFFPQLVAGPIIKGHEFMNQIQRKKIHDIDWYHVTKYLIIGYFLKGCVADNLTEITLNLSSIQIPSLAKLDLVLLLYGYSFQIFADFAGYSYIAMGLGLLMGYKFPANFNYPYLAQSITEFWHRWHISLSTWLKEYLYIPLGGNRKSTTRTYVNLFATMFLGGLWHGAAWSYAVWGTAHGVFLAVERMITPFWPNVSKMLVAKLIRVFYTFNVVSLLWLMFKLSDFQDVILYFQALFSNEWYSNPGTLFIVVLFGSPVVICHVVKFLHLSGDKNHSLIRNSIAEACCLGLMLSLIITNLGCPGKFIYFQF